MAAQSDFTVADVLAFARAKPARERYNYHDVNNCALGQFARHKGLHYDERLRLERSEIGMAACRARTFGKFAKRLERLVPKPARRSIWTRVHAYLTDIELANA